MPPAELLRQVVVSGAILVALLVSLSCRHDGSRRARGSANRAPSAQLTVSGERSVGSILTFDGRTSTDPDGDALGVDWTLAVKPSLSGLGGEGLASGSPLLATMTPDAPGAYKVRLTVMDSELAATASAQVIVRADGSGGPGGDEDRVDLICPASGYRQGGDLVRLTGGPFPPGTRVRFAGVLADEVSILEDGTVLSVKTPAASLSVSPPASFPWRVDITLELFGDQAILIPQAFTYWRGPLRFDSSNPLDILLDADPVALAGTGPGRMFAGLPRGRLAQMERRADGVVSVNVLQIMGDSDPIVELAAGAPYSDGTTDVVAIGEDRHRVVLLRVDQQGKLTALDVPFQGKAVSVALADIEPGGQLEILVADRKNRRLVLYHQVVTPRGISYLPFGEYPIGGQPCTLVALQLDDDPELEILVGSVPGPALTLVDRRPGKARVQDMDLEGIVGITVLRAFEASVDGTVELASIVVEAVAPDGEETHALRFLRSFLPSGNSAPRMELDASLRFGVEAGSGRCEVADLDGDGDLDIVLFDDAEPGIRVLRNTAQGEPETPAECEELAATGAMAQVPRFRVVEVRAFPSSGLEALALVDWNGDGFLDIAACHATELRGCRVLANRAGE